MSRKSDGRHFDSEEGSVSFQGLQKVHLEQPMQLRRTYGQLAADIRDLLDGGTIGQAIRHAVALGLHLRVSRSKSKSLPGVRFPLELSRSGSDDSTRTPELIEGYVTPIESKKMWPEYLSTMRQLSL